MRELGLRGVRRGRPVLTTRADRHSERAPDLVDRNFTAARPNQLWVVDLTYVPQSVLRHSVWQPPRRGRRRRLDRLGR